MHPAPKAPVLSELSDLGISSREISGARSPLGHSALVYCEGLFGEQDGKTANGLVRSSERYQIQGIIDSTCAGQDSGMVLDAKPNGIPIYGSLAEALVGTSEIPDYLICGLAPASGSLASGQRAALLEGIARGMHLVNEGLHRFSQRRSGICYSKPCGRRHDHRRSTAEAKKRT